MEGHGKGLDIEEAAVVHQLHRAIQSVSSFRQLFGKLCDAKGSPKNTSQDMNALRVQSVVAGITWAAEPPDDALALLLRHCSGHIRLAEYSPEWPYGYKLKSALALRKEGIEYLGDDGPPQPLHLPGLSPEDRR
jgi:hypothetical protein